VILLDTDVMVDVLRRFPPAVAWLESLGDEVVALPGFVVMELLDGAQDRDATNRIQKALAPYWVHWPTPEDCDRALAVFARGRLSHSLSPFDALIAETAKGLEMPLQTFNQKHFAGVPGLITIRPYARSR